MASRSVSASERGRAGAGGGRQRRIQARGARRQQLALEQVAQLAQVARPVLLGQPAARAFRQLEPGTREALREVGEHRRGHRQDVRAPFAQRRQPEGEHLEPPEEVAAEDAALDPAGEVLGSDRLEADVGRHLAAAERGVAPLGEQAQQLGLAGERQLLDVVEQQRAALGARDPAGVAPLGAGEGAGAVAEQLALEQRGRQGARIDLDQGPGGAAAGRVQRARQGRAPGARLAQNEQRRVAGGGALERGELAGEEGRG